MILQIKDLKTNKIYKALTMQTKLNYHKCIIGKDKNTFLKKTIRWTISM